MSGVRHAGGPTPPTPHPKKQAPVPSKDKPQPKPREDEDDGLFRDDLLNDGWRKTDSPGSGGGFGIKTDKKKDPVTRPKPAPGNDDDENRQLDLFRDTVDIKFPAPKK